MDFIAGEVLHFDKPLSWTSFDLVNKVRFALINHLKVKKLKVGHTGTLDPLATGLVTICTGKATRRIDELQALEKEYVAELKLGATTPSFDLETEVDATYPYEHITRDLLDEKLQQFMGSIMQTPPAFSAVKVDGVRAYKLARKGKEVALKEKELVIESIEIVDFDLPQCTLKIVCSKGTYIRALARDIGKSLDSGAHLTGLRRTRVADVLVEDSITLEEFCAHYIKTDNEVVGL
ncbi:MAG: tRNA pseudouridine(55) synthase TruB [Bacteroidales bacterium]|jgi:tRNA pseudouridine55 synthase|nr:tRNA pseudouridine(55) synthase TruB [Bacteroidales bacterium]